MTDDATRALIAEAKTASDVPVRFARRGRYVLDTERERRAKAFVPEAAQDIADQLNDNATHAEIEAYMWQPIPAPNYDQVCGECREGAECEQPYVSFDGTTYWCTRIFPATKGQNDE